MSIHAPESWGGCGKYDKLDIVLTDPEQMDTITCPRCQNSEVFTFTIKPIVTPDKAHSIQSKYDPKITSKPGEQLEVSVELDDDASDDDFAAAALDAAKLVFGEDFMEKGLDNK